jgi:hypothetical protein
LLELALGVKVGPSLYISTRIIFVWNGKIHQK